MIPDARFETTSATRRNGRGSDGFLIRVRTFDIRVDSFAYILRTSHPFTGSQQRWLSTSKNRLALAPTKRRRAIAQSERRGYHLYLRRRSASPSSTAHQRLSRDDMFIRRGKMMWSPIAMVSMSSSCTTRGRKPTFKFRSSHLASSCLAPSSTRRRISRTTVRVLK